MKRISCVFGVFSLAVLQGCGGGSAASKPPSGSNPLLPPSSGDLPTPPPPPAGADYHPEGKGWVQAWSDEFDGNSIDPAKWEVEISCWGGGNDERQCYTDRERNVQVVNGLLWLKAYPETFTGPEFPQGRPGGTGGQVTQQYTSGKVRTRERADWTYGRFEARIKLPTGQGTWPAFWMLPSDDIYGNWAASGEIDIMETVNLGEICAECTGGIGENRSSGTLHFGGEWPDNASEGEYYTLPGGRSIFSDYHVFAVEWGEGRFNWFVDGVKFQTVDADQWFSASVDRIEFPNAPFDQDFYLMFNLAVGGTYPEGSNGTGFDPNSFPNELLVDWVRVYQCEFDNSSGRNCMD